MHEATTMVGRPPDMRSLERESISSLAVLDRQSAGRGSRVINTNLRRTHEDERTRRTPGRRHHKTQSTVYVERLESSEIIVSLKGWGTQAINTRQPSYNREIVRQDGQRMRQKQRVPTHDLKD